MATYISKIKYVRGSARKARIPAQVVKGMPVNQALPVLEYMNKRAATAVYKAVKSASSNAVNGGAQLSTLIVSDIRVDKAPGFKRMKPGSKGRPIFFAKHNCHITVEVTDNVGSDTTVSKATKEASKVEKKSEKAEKKPVKKPAAKAGGTAVAKKAATKSKKVVAAGK